MGRVVASAYLASQLALAHVTLGALFRTKHLLGMGAFLLYMVPSELSHFLLLFDTLVLVRIYRRRDDPNSVLGSVIGRSATALHAFLTLLHAVLLYRNIRSRRHFVAAFAKAGIPLALSPLALPLLMRRMGSRVRVRRNIPIFISSIPPKRRRLAEMDVYSLPNVADDAPYFVYIHGGGWIGGDKKFAALPLLHRVAEAGWVVVSINYGLAPRNALVKQVADVKYAIHMIKRVHGKTFGGNPNIMVVGGESAGGHLAVLTALTQNDPTVRSGAKLGKDVSYLNMGCIVPLFCLCSFVHCVHAIFAPHCVLTMNSITRGRRRPFLPMPTRPSLPAWTFAASTTCSTPTATFPRATVASSSASSRASSSAAGAHLLCISFVYLQSQVDGPDVWLDRRVALLAKGSADGPPRLGGTGGGARRGGADDRYNSTNPVHFRHL